MPARTVMNGLCTISGCGKPYLAKGYCALHYRRMRIHGDPSFVTDLRRGEPRQFIEESLLIETDDCIEWPFSRNEDGYGSIHPKKGEKGVSVSRLVCIAAHGDPPKDRNYAAHSCGNPPCINKRHLRWATQKENVGDQLIHGTRRRGTERAVTKLTEAQVHQIRALRGKLSCVKIGKLFGVGSSTVDSIFQKHSWAWLA